MVPQDDSFKPPEDTSCEGLAALKDALQAEKEGIRTYNDMAGITSDPTGINMFAALARDEEDHANILREQITRLEEGLNWCEYDQRESVIQKLVPNLQAVEVRKRSTEGANELDALRVALDQEKTSIELYNREAQNLKDENAREMYRRLAAMEEAHYDILQAQIDYIEGTGYWFGVPEFSLEKQ